MNCQTVRVLLMGEKTDDMLALSRWLADRGCACNSVTTFRDAIERLAYQDFDVMLCTTALHKSVVRLLIAVLQNSQTNLFDFGILNWSSSAV